MKASNWPYCTCGDGSRVVGPTGMSNVVLCLCGLNLEKGEATYVVQIVWSLFIKIVI